MLISLVIYFSVFKCHTVYNCYTEPVVWISYILAKKKKKSFTKRLWQKKSASVIMYDSTESKTFLKKA